MKAVTDVAEGGSTVYVGPERPQIVIPERPSNPPGGLGARTIDAPVAQEERLYHHKLPAALAYARANGLNRIIREGDDARIGVVAAGKAWQDLLQALGNLGLSDNGGALGLRLLKVGMVWPLDPRLQPRIKQFDADRVALDALSASVEEVRSLLDESDKPYLRSGARVPASIEKGIIFENVSLHYDSGKSPALKQMTCSINIGETTAFVGHSGAGKSSLISLICRFYDPSSGRLLIDGVPLPELDLAWWRNQIAVVSQEVYLFNASVAENITYGKLDATREELVEAARKAHAMEFIEELPEGFETILGDRGIRLSGGQRQRLALARAFIRDPQILILDEATNSLDLISEGVVLDALEQFGRNRTVLIVAHRISTIEHADKIIVLDSGRVAESGTVTQLLAAGGLFSRFYALQLRNKHSGEELRAHALSVQ